MSRASGLRKSLITKIHIAANDLGMSKSDRQALQVSVTGKESCSDMTTRELDAVLKRMFACGWQGPPARREGDRQGKPRRDRMPPDSREAMLAKVEAMLAEKGRVEGVRVPWDYALAILKRQYGVDRLEWATVDHLRGLIAALYRDAKRHGRRTD